MAAHQTGAPVQEVSSATEQMGRQMISEGRSLDEVNNFTIKRINSSAKGNGFQSLAYAGFTPTGAYDEAALKGGGMSGMEATAGSVDLEKMESGQIYRPNPAGGPPILTTFGQALFNVSTAGPTQTSQAVRKFAATLQGPGKAATKQEVRDLIAYMNSAGVTVNGNPIGEEVRRIMEGRT
jgi:hypothetical protein